VAHIDEEEHGPGKGKTYYSCLAKVDSYGTSRYAARDSAPLLRPHCINAWSRQQLPCVLASWQCRGRCFRKGY